MFAGILMTVIGDAETLLDKGIIRKLEKYGVKILGDGEQLKAAVSKQIYQTAKKN